MASPIPAHETMQRKTPMGKTGVQKIRNGKWFTLLELLVIMAVIAVLIALLLPTLSSAKSMGRRIQCASNLRQIHGGLMVYAADWNACIPPATCRYQPPLTGNNGWQSVLCLYIPTRRPGYLNRVFLCPEAPRSFKADLEKLVRTYSVPRPSFEGAKGYDPVNCWPKHLSEVRNPSLALWVFDAANAGPGTLWSFDSSRWEWVIADPLTYIDFRHTQRMGGLFADGHVSFLHLSDLKSKMWKDD